VPGPRWSGDPDTPELTDNLARLYPQVLAHAASGDAPDMELVCAWHEKMHEGIASPSPAYIGRFRGSNHTDLLDFENQIGGVPGTRSYLVWGEVQKLIGWLAGELERIEQETAPSSVERDMAALELAATVHGEWVRIHPFVNANGRTARLWVLWICARFDIPPLLRIRPRPDKPYGTVSFSSMAGDHSQMVTLLKQEYAALP